MIQVGLFGLIGFAIFVAIELLVVETWTTRIVLAAIVGGLWLYVGPLAAMIGAALLSVGVLIGSKIPRVSKL